MKDAYPGLIFRALLLILPGLAFGQDGWNTEIDGFLMGNYSARAGGRGPAGGVSDDFLLAEERLRLDLSAWPESIEASARFKGDLVHDALTGEFDIDLREAFVDYSTGDFDFRLGRQIATWGVGDLLFVNDVFPKDWVAFLTGRPLEYLKIGVDGFRTRYSSDRVNAELLVIPFFEPDQLPAPDRFSVVDPYAQVPARLERTPEISAANTELALRLYRKFPGVDLSVYVYRGFWRTPGQRPDRLISPTQVIAFYPDLSVYGMSAQGKAFSGILSVEAGYYDSRDDDNGDDPVIPNSQFRFLAGYQRQLWQDASLGIQYYAEIMADHRAYRDTLTPGLPVQKKYRDVVTLRLDQLLEHQTWRLSMMCFYSPADNDYLIQPQVTRQISDTLAATMGANIFGGGRNWTAFGRFAGDSNVYLSLRLDF